MGIEVDKSFPQIVKEYYKALEGKVYYWISRKAIVAYETRTNVCVVTCLLLKVSCMCVISIFNLFCDTFLLSIA